MSVARARTYGPATRWLVDHDEYYVYRTPASKDYHLCHDERGVDIGWANSRADLEPVALAELGVLYEQAWVSLEQSEKSFVLSSALARSEAINRVLDLGGVIEGLSHEA